MSRPPVQRVVVLGGGSAGWLTASLLAARHAGRLSVVVIESPDIAPIGVGEGTWPTMRDTLREIGIRETDFIRECEATFKQGSLFVGWATGAPGDRYFHPFALPQGYTEAPLAAAWLGDGAPMPFAAAVSPQPLLCDNGLAPKQATTPEYAAVVNYGYHFDSGRLGGFLRRHAVAHLAVEHVADTVTGVRHAASGDIAALVTTAHGEVTGDLFIDCSGLKAQLLHGCYGVQHRSHRQALGCDSALAMQVPFDWPDAPIASCTVATAQDCGWTWDIGLQQRRGVGLVFDSRLTAADEAERTLRRHVASTGTHAEQLAVRALRFDPGHRERFWERNCVAIGLSAGFLEPLEASSLALVEFSADYLCQQMPSTREGMDAVAQRFNQACLHRWSRIIDFLKLHYVLSQRRDSAFWRAQSAPETASETLRALLALWDELPPSRHDLPRNDEPFPSASWQYVLYGMGHRPQHLRAPSLAQHAQARGYFQAAAEQARKMAAALPSHRALIDHARRHGMSRI